MHKSLQNNMFWKEEYNVGNKVIDDAHISLFREIRRVEAMLAEDTYTKYDCIETVKFLRDYTTKHFAQEEGYMRSLNYEFYDMHKNIHENMIKETLPSLEQDLRDRKYSKEAISDFIAVFAGWLTGHVLIEDRAITGKAESKYIRHQITDYDVELALDSEIKSFMKDMLDLKISLINKMYDGTKLDDSFMYEVTFDYRYHVTMIAKYSLIVAMVSKMMGVEVKELNGNIILAYSQLANSIAKAVLEIIYSSADFEITSKQGTVKIDFEEHFHDNLPQLGMLWSSDKGPMALCVDVKE